MYSIGINFICWTFCRIQSKNYWTGDEKVEIVRAFSEDDPKIHFVSYLANRMGALYEGYNFTLSQ